MLLIQQLFNWSDEQMGFQLLDRLSFQRFVGLRHSSQIPDRTTIWTFKERLIQAGASESIFDAVNRQLSMHGYSRCPLVCALYQVAGLPVESAAAYYA